MNLPSYNPWIDLPILVFAFFAATYGLLYWVFKTEQDDVPKTKYTARKASFRLAIVAIAVGCFSYFSNIAVWFLFLAAAVFILLMLTGEAIGILGAAIAALLFFIKEYALGFPQLVLSPKDRPAKRTTGSDAELVGRCAVAIGPLRPQGDITLDGKSLPAASENGTFIDAGESVVVTGSRNGLLFVTSCELE